MAHLNTFDLRAVLHLGDVIDGQETLEKSVDDLSNVVASFAVCLSLSLSLSRARARACSLSLCY